MACIERNQWNAAVAACNASQSVKGMGGSDGMGIWGHKRRTAQAGLGILGDINTLNVTPTASDSACLIAAQAPCPPSLKSVCATNPTAATCQPGGKTWCLTHTGDPLCSPKVVASLLPPPTTADGSTKMSGFMKVGLLAALVVGGAVVYKVSTHKKKAS